jgi:hypothetical protein
LIAIGAVIMAFSHSDLPLRGICDKSEHRA